MLFFDENISARVTFVMRALFVPSSDVRRLGRHRASDADLVRETKRLNAIFVTYDLDFTSKPLFAAMAKEGICVVLIRRPKGADLAKTAEIILRNYRKWPDLCGKEPAIISCSIRGNRLMRLRDLPFKVRPPVEPPDVQLRFDI